MHSTIRATTDAGCGARARQTRVSGYPETPATLGFRGTPKRRRARADSELELDTPQPRPPTRRVARSSESARPSTPAPRAFRGTPKPEERGVPTHAPTYAPTHAP